MWTEASSEEDDEDDYMEYVRMGESEDEGEGTDAEVDDDKDSVVPDTTQYDNSADQWDSDAYPYPVQYINGIAYPAYEAAHARHYGYGQYGDYSNARGETEAQEPSAAADIVTNEGHAHGDVPLDPAMWDNVQPTNGEGDSLRDQVLQKSPVSPESSDDEEEQTKESEEVKGDSKSETEDDEDEDARCIRELRTALAAELE